MGVKIIYKLTGIVAILLIILTLIAFASQFIDNTQSEFNLGTYTNTTYNGSAVVLSQNNISGTYTSQVFDATADASWNNLTYNSNEPSIESLFTVDGQADIWKSYNQGGNWTLIKDDYNGADNNGATDMAKNLSGSLFILYNQDIWASNDEGATWTKINDDYNGAEGQNGFVLGIDKNNNLIIVEGDQDVWKSTDSGSTFTKIATNFNGGNGNVFGIAVNSSNVIFVVDNQADVWQSVDSGSAWTLVKDDYNGAAGNNADDMAINSSGALFILDDQDVWKSTDSGSTWTKVNDDFNGAGDTYNGKVIYADANDSIYIIDGNEDVFKSTDSGSTFTKVATDFNGANGNVFGLTSIQDFTNLTFQVRNCSQSDCSDGTWQNVNLNNINLTSRYFQYKVSFRSPDSSATSALYNVTIDYTLLNQQPVVSSLTLTPSSPKTTNDLTCSFIITDSDAGDSLTTNITWYKNGAVYSSVTQSVTNGTQSSSILDSSNTAKNEIWNCTIIPYDGKAYGNQISSKLTIQNTAPTIGSIPNKSTDSQIYWSYDANASDIDVNEGIDTLTWSINNSMLNINSATGIISDTPSDSDEGIYNIKVIVSDGTDIDSTTFTYTITANRAPNITSITLTPSQPKTNDNLNCSFTITDDRLQQLTANISWYRNNILNITTNISVNNNTLTSTIFNYQNTTKNEEWNCTIIPYDNNSYGNKASSKVTILNSPPTPPNISITPSSPITTNDLNVVFNAVSQDNDSDTITYTYQWYKNGVLQPGITGSTVSNGVTSKNEIWLVNVTPNDGVANGEKATATVTIQNSIPSITLASITPTTAYETTTLTASAEGWSDLDNEPENYLYQWFNQNGAIAGATSQTLTGTYFNKTDQIYSNVTPYDSDNYGTSKLTNTIVIQNSLPVLTVSITSELGFNGTDEDLIGSFTYSDADSDAITNNQTKWYKNNIEQTNLADLIRISYTNLTANNVWVFSARVNDGEGWSNWYNASITILDISQTYPTLVSPSNGTYFNTNNVVLTYTTPNYANMNCTIFADTYSNPITPIKINTNLQGKTTLIYNWQNLADNKYYWKAGCTNDSILYNSTIKTFTIDTTYPTTAPTLLQSGVSDSDNDGNIELSWTADPDANTYNIYKSSTQITDAANLTKIGSTSSTLWEDNTTLHNNTYWYAITTIDAANNENKSIVSDSFNATSNDLIKPKLPTNVNASSLNGITTIYWNKVILDINGNSDESNLQYKIWYKQNSTVNLSKTSVNETADYIKTISQDSCSENSCSTTHSLSASIPYYYFVTTIDDANNENLTLDNNFANVTATIAPPTEGSSGGSGGGGGGRTIIVTPKGECKEDWSCSEWYSCVNNIQARTCVDVNGCGTEINKPKETRPCAPCEEEWQCGDWTPCVNNRQTRVCIDKNDCGTDKNKPEEGRDCNIDTCSDGVKNYGEVGIDCGGPCRACEAKDFITGSAIRLRATKGPNPILLIPTIFLLIAFIVIRTIRKSDILNKIVSAMHVPMIILIVVLLIFSFFGPQITGLFIAGNETIKEESLDYGVESESKQITKIQDIPIFKFDEAKAKITSTILLLIISITLIGFIVKKRFPIKFKKKIKIQKIKKEIEKERKLETKEENIPIEEIKDMEIEVTPIKSEQNKIEEEPFEKVEETPKEVIKEMIKEIQPNKQEILNQIKEAYKIDQLK